MGHVMRDLVLARQIKDAEIIFACQDLDGNIMDKIPYSTIILDTNDSEELIEVLKKHAVDFLVIDHYAIGFEEERKIKKSIDIKILSFDDNYQKHYCDILLNQSLHASEQKYDALVQPSTTLLCGREYILIHGDFFHIRKSEPKNDHILVALGGGEIRQEIIKIVECIKRVTSLPIVVIGRQVSDKDFKDGQIICKTFTDDMPQLMYDAKLVVSSLGMTAYEVMFLKKPVFPLKTAQNQKEIAKFFVHHGVSYMDLKDINFLSFEKRLKEVLQDSELSYPENWINPKQDWINQFL